MFTILNDAEGRHNVFISFGAIALNLIESWMRFTDHSPRSSCIHSANKQDNKLKQQLR
jgi:hypothetical protein